MKIKSKNLEPIVFLLSKTDPTLLVVFGALSIVLTAIYFSTKFITAPLEHFILFVLMVLFLLLFTIWIVAKTIRSKQLTDQENK